MKTLPILVTCVLFFSAACSEKSGSGYTVETIDGIEYVHNPGIPLYPEKTVEFEEDLTISAENNKGEILLYLPHQLGVDGDGRIYVSDYQDSSIKVFDKEGRYVKTIGRKGEGPGEFQTVGRLSFLPDGRFIVLDWSQKRISVFGADDEFISSHNYQGSSFDLFLTGNGYYVREDAQIEPGAREMEFKRRLFLKAYDLSGEEIRSFGEFTAMQSGFINEPDGRFNYTLPYFVCSIFAGDGHRERLYHCLNDKYVIEVLDKEGKIIRKIDRPYERIPTTSGDMKNYIQGFARSSQKQRALIEKLTKMPEVKTVTDRMIVDDAGNLWIETQEMKDIDGKRVRAYDIFDQKGIYVYRVWLEKSPGLFRGEHMYRLERDEETDYRYVKRYRVVWSSDKVGEGSGVG